ncbi:MAG: phosphoribosylamine--glycine ligase [Bacteroidetes bacterium]|nr:phosphoribosylamine--glycine ligase [Bacteroidota bacterium]MBM3425012.1 phosphoribosylamine--glycine ligase [Bacteroidota bacterium]
MNVLLLGSGGRESALAWKLAQSSMQDQLFIAPGNAGTRPWGKNVPMNILDFEAVKTFVLANKIDLVFVGPEEPLVLGIVDYFQSDDELRSIGIIGPSKAGAQLEGSKSFAKEFMHRHRIPTAKFGSFSLETLREGIAFLREMKAPYVLKADGLAAGKGVLILEQLEEAELELTNILLDEKFGAAGKRVVIEQFLSGTELSMFILTDGSSFKVLPEAKDYKRIGERDQGPNTGGMGAVSPVPFADAGFKDKVLNQIIIPTVKGLSQEGIDYKGFIFFGLINVKGDPYVIEYNCRLGDPETEVVVPRIKSDLLDLLEGVVTNTLSERDIQFTELSAATVMMVSGGYPNHFEKDKIIYGLNAVTDSLVFHAATKSDGPKILTNGGRVLSVTSYGKNIELAIAKSYESISKISFDQAYYRTDIGKDLT